MIMKERYLLLVSFAFVILTFAVGTKSYRQTAQAVNSDMSQALAEALAEYQTLSTDTIQAFNRNLQMAELRGKATLAVDTHRQGFHCYAECSPLTILWLSDQRLTIVLSLMTILWLTFAWRQRRRRLAAQPVGLSFDGIHLTPMQHQLMTMFVEAEGHELRKEDICCALWPGKPDASETLYTLMRRLRTVLEAQSQLRIETDRGRSYRLTNK